ncbi:hypothetical protein BAUCODRAFT_153226 [Baudoinia panamericana UAMH 10762]|uniref:DUF6594 domain-containing protein n=1 Tax=Baudoinia panamericana (strain UAMH 10762) TaxID=717646 RepID=M2NNJ7_BAUPA|nr:uncharacterized protein BAUCODRAFT_153226 [Baudoinia panamericana UAMH 10762]EMD00811.1 hypothetical protein BAUCODRAFT_153226 [Baudoinia panamericana UAMH 10762]
MPAVSLPQPLRSKLHLVPIETSFSLTNCTPDHKQPDLPQAKETTDQEKSYRVPWSESAPVEAEFEVNDRVRTVDSSGRPQYCKVSKREYRNGFWRYKLKIESTGRPYSNGAWIKEGDVTSNEGAPVHVVEPASHQYFYEMSDDAIKSKIHEKPDEPLSPDSANTPGDVESGKLSERKNMWLLRILLKSSADGDRQLRPPDQYTSLPIPLNHSSKGYDQVAVFQASDRNFLQYRGFGVLHCRVLSVLENELSLLGLGLEKHNAWDRGHGKDAKLENQWRDEIQSPKDFAAGFYPPDIKCTHPDLLRKLCSKLIQYDELLLKTKETMALQRPANRDYETVRTWFRDHEPVIQKEAAFIRWKEDIVTLRNRRESSGFDGFIEHCLSGLDGFRRKCFGRSWIQNMSLTAELRKKCTDGDIHYFSPARVDALVNIIITIAVFALPVLPVVILYKVMNMGRRQSPLDAIGVLIVLIFGMAISSLTTAKRAELFGASAAYCGILVVFLGNTGINQ